MASQDPSRVIFSIFDKSKVDLILDDYGLEFKNRFTFVSKHRVWIFGKSLRTPLGTILEEKKGKDTFKGKEVVGRKDGKRKRPGRSMEEEAKFEEETAKLDLEINTTRKTIRSLLSKHRSLSSSSSPSSPSNLVKSRRKVLKCLKSQKNWVGYGRLRRELFGSKEYRELKAEKEAQGVIWRELEEKRILLSHLKQDKYQLLKSWESGETPLFLDSQVRFQPSRVKKNLKFEQDPKHVDLTSLVEELESQNLTLNEFMVLGGIDPGVTVM